MTDLKDKIYKILDDKQVEDLTVLNFENYSPFVDYFIIGSVRNARMANAAIVAVDELCDKEGIKVKSKDTNSESKWFLIDCGSVVVHIFYDGERQKYDLEGLWKDLIEK